MEFTNILNIDNNIKKYFKPIWEEYWFKENNWNKGLWCACLGGHIDIVKLMSA